MKFNINEYEKNDIQRINAQNKKSIRIIKTISRFILLAGTVGGFTYGALNCLSPKLSLVRVNGVLQKDYGSIIGMSLTIILPSIVLFICLKALLANLSSSNNAERIDESLVLDRDILRYTFRIVNQSNRKDRNVITVPLEKIHEVHYTSDTKALLFKGSFVSDYVDNYGPSNTSSGNEEEIDEMLIYDYFKPSLFDKLEENGINIQ